MFRQDSYRVHTMCTRVPIRIRVRIGLPGSLAHALGHPTIQADPDLIVHDLGTPQAMLHTLHMALGTRQGEQFELNSGCFIGFFQRSNKGGRYGLPMKLTRRLPGTIQEESYSF